MKQSPHGLNEIFLFIKIKTVWDEILSNGGTWSQLLISLVRVQVYTFKGFPGGTSGKEAPCQCGRHEGYGLSAWVGRILWQRAWQPTPVFLPGESHGQRSLAGCSPWGRKESDTTEQLKN